MTSGQQKEIRWAFRIDQRIIPSALREQYIAERRLYKSTSESQPSHYYFSDNIATLEYYGQPPTILLNDTVNNLQGIWVPYGYPPNECELVRVEQ